jgi:sarcosine oxidase gamma subunit
MTLRTSPIDDAHRVLHAKMVPFGGWDMPLSYPNGTLAEHRACRRDAVAFDVSHLGTVRVEGPEAHERLQRAFTNDLGKIEPGRAQYTHLLDEADASVLDDIIVWWVAPDVFDVMPNASNTDRVTGALAGGAGTTVDDVTATRAILETAGRVKAALRADFPELEIFGDPLFVVAFRSVDDTLDIYRVLDAMTALGWSLNGLHRPAAVHLCVTQRTTQPGVTDRFVVDLRAAIDEVRAHPTAEGGMAPIYGMANTIPERGLVAHAMLDHMDSWYRLP